MMTDSGQDTKQNGQYKINMFTERKNDDSTVHQIHERRVNASRLIGKLRNLY